MEAFTITAPAYWASYLINGDASGLDDAEKAQADAWLDREGVDILDVARNEDGEAHEAYFTCSMRLHAPEFGCAGGDVLDYIATALEG